MITIKGVTTANQTIEWNYDKSLQASRQWRELTATGKAPGSGESLIRAYYFGPKNKPGDGPDKAWAS